MNFLCQACNKIIILILKKTIFKLLKRHKEEDDDLKGDKMLLDFLRYNVWNETNNK
jgi:hypothetical protein